MEGESSSLSEVTRGFLPDTPLLLMSFPLFDSMMPLISEDMFPCYHHPVLAQ